MNKQEQQQQILNFLQDKEQKTLKLDDTMNRQTLFYKVSLNNFDYVYCIKDISNGFIDINSRYDNNNFACIIDTRTNKVYFTTYHIKDFFEYYDRDTKQTIICDGLKSISKEFVNNEINSKLEKEISIIAKNINKREIAEEEQNYLREDAEKDYYLNTVNDVTFDCLNVEERNIPLLLEYLQDENAYINKIIEAKKDDILGFIETKKAFCDAIKKYIEEIETSEKYKYLRLAKQIKDSIPENAKQVVLYYKLNNGEVLQGKYSADAFAWMPYMPYGANDTENLHYSGYSLDAKAREKIKQTQGYDDDIKVKNILKITYNGKTIFENN